MITTLIVIAVLFLASGIILSRIEAKIELQRRKRRQDLRRRIRFGNIRNY